MGKMFEKLAAANAAGKHLCIGLDPDPVHARKVVRRTGYGMSDALLDDEDYSFEYAAQLISATGQYAACFKANYEFWINYDRTLLPSLFEGIRRNFPEAAIILDRKFGDIGNTSARSAAFAKKWKLDGVTTNPYMSAEDVGSEFDKAELDYFMLCLTSNPHAARLQKQRLVDGRMVYELVADDAVAAEYGLVVGATKAEELAALAKRVPKVPFLIPGVGAQGGELEKVIAAMRSHQAPWIVNIGRGIAEASDDPEQWKTAIVEAARKYHDAMAPLVA